MKKIIGLLQWAACFEALAIAFFYFFVVFMTLIPQNSTSGNGYYNDPMDLKLTHQVIDGKKLSAIDFFAYAPIIAIDKHWEVKAKKGFPFLELVPFLAAIPWLLALLFLYWRLDKAENLAYPEKPLYFSVLGGVLGVQTLLLFLWASRGMAMVHNTLPW